MFNDSNPVNSDEAKPYPEPGKLCRWQRVRSQLVKLAGKSGPVYIAPWRIRGVMGGTDQNGTPMPGTTVIFVDGCPPLLIQQTPETVAALIQGNEPPPPPSKLLKFPGDTGPRA